MDVKVKLIKDRPPYDKGQFLNVHDIENYISLVKDGYINDEHKLIKKEKKKKENNNS